MWIQLDSKERAQDILTLLRSTVNDFLHQDTTAAYELNYLADRIQHFLKEDPRAEKYQTLAGDLHIDGELEFDDDAVVSIEEGEEEGAYVMGWHWIEKEDADVC